MGKKIGKKVVNKASKVISKGKNLKGGKLLTRTKDALKRASKKIRGNKTPKLPKRNKHIPKIKSIGAKFQKNGKNYK